jgi:Sel1 repeat-containing protein
MNLNKTTARLVIASAAFIAAIQGHRAHAGEKETVSAQLASLQSNDLPRLFSQAETGDSVANLVIGEVYYRGQLLPKDLQAAAEHYRVAAKLGSPAAQNSLGYLYDKGLGVPPNRTEAVYWYSQAAKQNYPVAMYNLGALFESGDETVANMEEAIIYYRRAAELGYPDAIAIMKDIVATHDTEESDTIANFLEDILALLPMELAELLDKDANTLYREAQPATNGNYWQKRLPTKEALTRDWGLLKKQIATNHQQLVMLFGATIPTIIEASMVPRTYDPLNEQLQSNVKRFLRNGSYQRYLIRYPGYLEQSIPGIVDRLCVLALSKKDDLYPQLVTLTADLWTTLWHNGRRKVATTPYNILRRSFVENFQGQQGDP